MSTQETHICPPSVAKWLNSPIRTILENPRKLMKPYIKPGMNVIDLGCGGGIFSVTAAKMTDSKSHVYAVDLQQEMLDITQDFAKKKKVEEKISLHLCNADSVELDNSLADLLLAIDMIHETGDPASAFKEIARLTKQNGYLLVLEPKMHVNDELFGETLELADTNGFKLKKDLSTFMGRGAVFQKVDS